jgi:tetratricopeptide (TPR) repeat protein
MKAQDLLFNSTGKNLSKLQAMTYNNFGCYYKATGKLEYALNYLKKALGIERTQDFDVSNLAGTHLNISAIYSQMGSHGQSLTHAVTALKLLKSVCSGNNYKNITALIIALHNTGLEYEALGNIEKAASTFKYGLELSQQYLGNKHQYTTSLLKSFLSVTTTDKKYYFEKARLSRSRPKKSDLVLPKVKKRNSQDLTFNRKEKKHFLQTPDEPSSKFDFPAIEKPSTFGGRQKPQEKPEKNEYVKNLEHKVNFLQSQLADFEKRHKALEDLTRKKRRFSTESTFYTRSESNQRNRAAIIIQKHWRRFSAQKKWKILKNKKKVPVKKVFSSKKTSKFPSSMKKYSLHPIVESKFESKSQKATLIQSNFRRFLQRKNFHQVKNATIKIQSQVRRFICRSIFKNIIQAVKLIQRTWRSHQKKVNV